MRKQGNVVRWDEAKGFGFIESPQSGAHLFFHIRDWRAAGSPALRTSVSFEEIHVGGKGPRAMDVRPTTTATAPLAGRQPSTGPDRRVNRAVRGSAKRPTLPNSSAGPAVALMTIWLAFLVGGVVLGRLNWSILPVAMLLNLATFYLYWQDKFAASKGRWRTTEDTLHLFGLLGGWPGAWFAHQILRHKSAKQAFRNVYWATALVNVVALAAWVLLPWLTLLP
ncbi:MAG: cold shock and DUF1294 domain-containing protein [Hydrogenophaga sp.]|nr:cold shock and DUF1294 domain-containing protein [Hydrogenophaga sp.]